MIKSEALNILIGDEHIDDCKRRERLIRPIIKAAIADAQAEIDGYLAKRHALPLSTVPEVISKFAKDIALYNLFSRVGIDESDREKNYLNRYKAAIRYLELLAEGKVELGLSDPEAAARTGFALASNRRVFSRNSMKGL